jgi:hypothetical protein
LEGDFCGATACRFGFFYDEEEQVHRYLWSFVLVALTVALSVGVATASAGGGNSANAHLCQKGGWMDLQGSDGTRFANQGECVSFGAHGGTIVAIPPPPPSITMSFTPTSDPDFCNITANLSHFDPNTQYSITFTGHQGAAQQTFGPFTVSTDSTGAGSITPFSFIQVIPTTFEANVGAVGSGQQTVAC